LSRFGVSLPTPGRLENPLQDSEAFAIRLPKLMLSAGSLDFAPLCPYSAAP
jgi:hypothetical protein